MNNAIIPGSLSAIAQRENISLAESFLSAEIVILLDVSGSMGASDAPSGLTRKQAAENELISLQQKYPGKVALICFGSDVAFSPGGTPIYAGSTTNMAGALKFVKVADDTGLKIVLITDGEPDSKSETLKEARQFKSRIDAIFIGREGGSGMRFLNQLIGITGGKASESVEPGMLADGVDQLLLAG